MWMNVKMVLTDASQINSALTLLVPIVASETAPKDTAYLIREHASVMFITVAPDLPLVLNVPRNRY